AMFQRHNALHDDIEIEEGHIDAASSALAGLEQFWMRATLSAPRAPEPLIGKPVDRREAAAYFGD
ncbi:MAG: hypothetical protein RIM80_08140, partial [Alphaproteobacteria bacterium]